MGVLSHQHLGVQEVDLSCQDGLDLLLEVLLGILEAVALSFLLVDLPFLLVDLLVMDVLSFLLEDLLEVVVLFLVDLLVLQVFGPCSSFFYYP